jgi:hypothetical protein
MLRTLIVSDNVLSPVAVNESSEIVSVTVQSNVTVDDRQMCAQGAEMMHLGISSCRDVYMRSSSLTAKRILDMLVEIEGFAAYIKDCTGGHHRTLGDQSWYVIAQHFVDRKERTVGLNMSHMEQVQARIVKSAQVNGKMFQSKEHAREQGKANVDGYKQIIHAIKKAHSGMRCFDN